MILSIHIGRLQDYAESSGSVANDAVHLIMKQDLKVLLHLFFLRTTMLRNLARFDPSGYAEELADKDYYCIENQFDNFTEDHPDLHMAE